MKILNVTENNDSKSYSINITYKDNDEYYQETYVENQGFDDIKIKEIVKMYKEFGIEDLLILMIKEIRDI